MSKEREALKMALECVMAWDRGCDRDPYWRDIEAAVTAIKEALAEQPARHDLKPKFVRNVDGVPCITLVEHEQLMRSRSKPAQQQEPVAVYVGETWCGSVVRLYEDLPLETPLYTSPPASKPLTHEQIAKALADAGLRPEDYREDGMIEPLVRAIEAAIRARGETK